MKGAGLRILSIAAVAVWLAACGKRESIYLDHTRDEAAAPARKPAPAAAKPAQSAAANTTDANAPAETPAS